MGWRALTGWAFHHNRPPGWTPEQQAKQDEAMRRQMEAREAREAEKDKS